MLWVRLLAYVTGTVNQEPLLRNECLAAEKLLRRDFRAVILRFCLSKKGQDRS
jgi:hypothetical protein